MGQKLIDVGDEPERLALLALAFLLDESELASLAVVNGVLVHQLDQLGLLADDESVCG